MSASNLNLQACSIGPRSDLQSRTRAMSGEVFYGRTVRWLEGGRTAKGIVGRRRRTVGCFYSVLVIPYIFLRSIFNLISVFC